MQRIYGILVKQESLAFESAVMLRRIVFIRVAFLSVSIAISAAGSVIAAAPPVAGDKAAAPVAAPTDVATLQREIEQLKAQVKQLQPDITEAMLALQIRHARLWFAGERGDWTLAAFQVHGLQDGLDGVAETYPDHAALQPERLAEILPSMMSAPMKALRAAIDRKDKSGFERAYDNVSAACTGCHAVAGFTFLQIHRPQTPLLDNLSGEPAAPATAK